MQKIVFCGIIYRNTLVHNALHTTANKPSVRRRPASRRFLRVSRAPETCTAACKEALPRFDKMSPSAAGKPFSRSAGCHCAPPAVSGTSFLLGVNLLQQFFRGGDELCVDAAHDVFRSVEDVDVRLELGVLEICLAVFLEVADDGYA